MSGYKLADGTYSSEYNIGDKFEVVDGTVFQKGSIVTYTTDDNSNCPWFTNKHGQEWSCMWHRLKLYKEIPEVSSKQFTKSDLLDGMRVVYRSGGERIVFQGRLYESYLDSLQIRADLSEFASDLTDLEESGMDIMKVTDRDGTVLFTRQEVPAKSPAQIELEKLQEQITQLQKQADKLQQSL